jgi:cell wall-associated NlpC family hydrolase
MPTAAEVVTAARTHIGTPWVHQGRFPGLAIDCAGLVILVARELAIVPADFDVNGYAQSPDGTMLTWCERYMTRVPAIELGAVLVMATDQDPQHLGIVGDYVHGGWSLIHAANGAHPPRVIETRLLFVKNQRLRGIFRLPGIEVPA